MTKQEMREFAQSQVEWYTKQVEWDRDRIQKINKELVKTRKEDREMVEWAIAKYPNETFVAETYNASYKGQETKKLINERSKYYREIKKYTARIAQYQQEVIKYSEEAQEATNTNESESEEETTMKNTSKIKFEIREIDAWNYGEEEGWIWNTSYHMGEMITNAKDERRAFTAWMKRHLAISFKPNRTLIEYDGDAYTIIDRKTKEPLFAAIPNC